MEEASYYNALAVSLRSDYGKLAEIRGRFTSWQNAYNSTDRQGKAAANPVLEWQRLRDAGIKLILREDDAFPPLLQEIPWPPLGIYVRGNLPYQKLNLAVVGTRKATPEGKTLARSMAAALAENGFVVISGLALGIDAAAHEGCLSAGGITVAVLANGLDRLYPASNVKLAERILESGGALVSEYPPRTEPLPYRFLERNRLVSGLAKGTLIIEAPYGSGALATARFALEQNREVFVVPGPITHPNFKGSHELIRSGAELVTSAAEVIESFGFHPQPAASGNLALSSEEKMVLTALASSQTADIDKIKELTNLDISVINRTLSFLTIKNKIKESGGGYALI